MPSCFGSNSMVEFESKIASKFRLPYCTVYIRRLCEKMWCLTLFQRVYLNEVTNGMHLQYAMSRRAFLYSTRKMRWLRRQQKEEWLLLQPGRLNVWVKSSHTDLLQTLNDPSSIMSKWSYLTPQSGSRWCGLHLKWLPPHGRKPCGSFSEATIKGPRQRCFFGS